MSLRRCMGCMSETENMVCEKCGYSASFQNEPHQLPVGTLLQGKYMVGRVLGQGGFGITYLGWDTYLDIPVAIKEYYPNTMVNRESTHSLSVHCYTEAVLPGYVTSKERFLREAKALARFDEEPAIVRIKNFFAENETAYIVMEYIKGTDLGKYVSIRGGKLHISEVLRIMRPVMEALDVVHRSGLIHRDISPDNIILHPRGGAKLLDFGAVRSVENADAEKTLARSTEAILKHGFAPIEQYQNRGSLGPWTDVYALCGTIYYCLTGTILEDAPARMIEEQELDWSGIPDLTPRQKGALEKGLALRAKDRTASVGELMEQLYGSAETTAPAFESAPREKPVTRETPVAREKPVTRETPVARKKPAPGKKPAPKAPAKQSSFSRKVFFLGSIPINGRNLLLLTSAAAAVLVLAVLLLTARTGWYDFDGKYAYYTWPGFRLRSSWYQEENRFYHFDEDGFLETGWVELDGLRFYFGEDGVMATGLHEIDGKRYCFGTDGVLITGWRTEDGKKYYIGSDGEFCTGQQVIGGETYFFDEDGTMATGWRTVVGRKKYFGHDGVMYTGLREIDGETYYFTPNGTMYVGIIYLDGAYHSFGSDGRLLN